MALPPPITIAGHLNARAPSFKVDAFSRSQRGRFEDGGEFESSIFPALEPHVDEILGGISPGAVAYQIKIDSQSGRTHSCMRSAGPLLYACSCLTSA